MLMFEFFLHVMHGYINMDHIYSVGQGPFDHTPVFFMLFYIILQHLCLVNTLEKFHLSVFVF